jgi:hypothetical protein
MGFSMVVDLDTTVSFDSGKVWKRRVVIKAEYPPARIVKLTMKTLMRGAEKVD